MPARAGTVRTRDELERWTDRLLLRTRPFSSPQHALVTLPGTPSTFGTPMDGLEGFARTFLAVGFRIAGSRGADPHGYLERCAAGIAAGTDPQHAERWVRPSEHGQAKVEAASIALVLDLTRPWLWDRLAPRVQEQMVDYLAEVVGDETYPRNNWLWFRILVETFLRSVSGPHAPQDIRDDLERHDAYYERDGWYRDGEQRSYDHYTGWAMHLYPTLWSRMDGAQELGHPRAQKDRDRLDRYLVDAVRLVGGDGSPLPQGRSLTYRFATAAPFWAGAIAQVPSVSPGRLRSTALGILNHFIDHGVPNERGLLDRGWWRPWAPLAQSYSGTGSPYWASKGLLGLALPADHPVWSAPATAIAATESDRVFTIAAPVWAVSSTAGDGIVRVVNHGTDHADAGDLGGDSPLYARLGYSTATFPLHRGTDWAAPVDQSVVLVDPEGRRSHRAGMVPLLLTEHAGTVVAASRSRAHWLDAGPAPTRHGAGLAGSPTSAGTLTVVSAVRGPWEVRLVRTHDDLAAQAVALECGGWAVAHDAGVATVADGLRVDQSSPALSGAVVGLHGWHSARVLHRDGATPIGSHATVGVLHAPARPGWTVSAVGLAGAREPHALEDTPLVALSRDHATITWTDGTTTRVDLHPH
ncbi:MAG TPA: DUF2264 domain-containing protein [Cellulomonas sp.]